MVGFRIGFEMAKITGLLGLLSGGDFKEPLVQVGKRLERSTAQNFKKQQDPDGFPWAANSEYTLQNRRKAKGSGSPQILIDTGRLMQSVISQVTTNVTNTTLDFGTNVDYAEQNQYGNPNNTLNGHKAPIPARPFLGISELDKIVIGRVFEDYYRKLLAS